VKNPIESKYKKIIESNLQLNQILNDETEKHEFKKTNN
jgi:hypothetical protein